MGTVLGLKGFFERDLTKGTPPARESACAGCGRANELPWAFCADCGAPRLKLGHWRVTANLTMAMAAFFGTWWFAELGMWPWMLYAFYAVLFVQFALVFCPEGGATTRRVAAWVVAFLAAWGAIRHAMRGELGGMDFVVYVVQDVPDVAAAQPLLFWPCAAAVLVLLFLPVVFRWRREFGWVNAYRIALLSIAALFGAVLAAFRLAEWAHASVPAAADRRWLETLVADVLPEYRPLAALVALGAVRLFVFEIFVFSAVRGYAVANKGREVLDKSALARETGFVRALLLAGGVVRRFVSAIERMAGYLVQTLRNIAVDLAKVVVAFLRELFAPTVVLVLVAVALERAADMTVRYVDTGSLALAGSLAAILASLVLAECVLLACKSRYRIARILEIHVHVLGWLVPNALVFFVLVSLSLWASGAVLGGDGPDARRLPFAVGALTKGALALLALVAGFVLYRKRHVFVRGSATTPAAHEPSIPAPAIPAPAAQPEAPAPRVVEEPVAAVSEPTPSRPMPLPKGRFRLGDRLAVDEKKKSLLRAAGAAREAVLSSDLGQRGKKVLGGVQERLAGKPESVVSIEETTAKLAEVRSRLDALTKSRASISAKHYEEFRDRYGREEAELVAALAALQRTVDSDYARQYWEMDDLERSRAAAASELEELKTLHSAGAVDAKEFAARCRTLESRIEMAAGAVAGRRRRLEFYLPWVRDVEGSEYEPAPEPEAPEPASDPAFAG